MSSRTPVYENTSGTTIKDSRDGNDIECDSTVPDWNNNGFRLPTEGEWQFAATGGNSSSGYTYSGSNTVGDVAWYKENSSDLGSAHPDYGTQDVGGKQANELGLFDMSGNTYEWCFDWYSSYPSDTTDYTGASSGSLRVFRGGSWYLNSSFCPVSSRNLSHSYSENLGIGFRLAHD